jgi:L-2-hydroxyglutarate oxidase
VTTPTPDVIVIGAGAIGASAALHLARQGFRVTVLEKEPEPALHQSGRNSGVIHAGYNLKPGSLKARFCVEGSRRLRAYCTEKGVPLIEGGILIVARTAPELAVLDELYGRAGANGVAARLVDDVELRRIEPHAQGIRALHAPEGASFDSRAYVRALLEDAGALGVRVRYSTRVDHIEDPGVGLGGMTPAVRTSGGRMAAQMILNCGGLYADRLAGRAADDLRVIPFRGYYAELTTESRHLVRSHIYSAPDLSYPFLGVHLSRRADGRVIVGPGAMLAFGREAYSFFRVQPKDVWDMIRWPGFSRLLAQPGFLELVKNEVRKSLRLRWIWEEARLLVPELQPRDLVRAYAGNRAQLVSRDGRLVDDIVVRETDFAIHVLNAVSPGLTCSLPFGADLANRCAAKLGGSRPLATFATGA